MPQISRCSRHQLTIAVLSLVLSNLAEAATSNGVNAPAYATLCDIYNLKHAKPQTLWTRQFDNADDLITAIYNLNISTASDTWLEHKDGEFAGVSDGSERATKLANWVKRVKEATEQGAAPGKLGPYAKIANNAYKALANRQIHDLYNIAQTKKAAFEAASKEVSTAAARAERKILDTIYGEGKDKFEAATFNSTKENMCGNGHSGHNNVGYSILNDMICLCTADATDTDKACGEKGMGTVTADTTGADTAAAALETACTKKEAKQELSEALIQAKLATFFSHIGSLPSSHSNAAVRFVLGEAQSTGCQGSSNAQCVNYKLQLQNGGNGIPWVNHLEVAAAILRRAAIAYAEAGKINAELATLKEQATSLRNAAVIGIALPDGTAAAERLNEHKELSESAEQACNKLNSEQKCNADPKCSYEIESDGTKKCKYNATKAEKSGVSLPQTQTGGAETATDKCKGKGEKDCKAPDCK
ncbi:variant surface glycoprotein (VSG), putative [Trypanosoma brucei brucei TREU927]|uniref:Variant surface glycoprotein (VSG), putative n=1 Tax=Trypanosoma brucei brucei (strain 927/4 GUTat10.1) TaxID=185431 RepID=Q380V5_TRYB2|nr:variant surface glycoprotein [Trypanosoma brucei brucei TREU927]EAN80676.1 variant surface glycoprotein (VSG), putative [Trypanosoma brucei brucei TREU927]